MDKAEFEKLWESHEETRIAEDVRDAVLALGGYLRNIEVALRKLSGETKIDFSGLSSSIQQAAAQVSERKGNKVDAEISKLLKSVSYASLTSADSIRLNTDSLKMIETLLSVFEGSLKNPISIDIKNPVKEWEFDVTRKNNGFNITAKRKE